ncbi:regulator of G-protein signaling 9-binding protein [Latimeria chalumnae]|uniref:Zgc:109913 n=1 Tax=Latimeria chalumnae TaxID=7897 RepID=H3BH76_LATCH|nr:PREDICTED: regulator of G-protein signaling 9-binding protein-like [Latimeria chalumnae]XP_005986756.1 PREDICTED: regulator of G-protein signaling 9-binding protein-like [Latimeria chalumnae]XP_005986757.1 PREDICTED: regulator of G-protein signaling 9-binding protein-like [Latimeria chalumnae]XP_005986759.1 PREDICTED: regulator of G-protein signaling 9-binding protein-like [Latimeria chalumnae]XP_005986760.1 PREDICTED: regulator of G-protein signaling 9-binding protein-like [Latimeria chalum|eukprot:XP_005986755.1 PREDICTED: regulator of G-protein signaling 9-binding protein-like [Latimeria chalumnae]
MPLLRSRSVDDAQNIGELVKETKKAQALLSKILSCFRHLVLCIGGTSDSAKLREELEVTRKKAYILSTGLKSKLTMLLANKNLGSEHQSELERMWVLFLSCMEQFQQDLGKVLHFSQMFPLNVRGKHLVNTGMTGKTSGIAARVLNVQINSEVAENADSLDLKQHIDFIGKTLQEMELKANIPIWSVEANEEAWAEVTSAVALEDASSNDVLTMDESTNRHCCYRGCWLICVIS